MSGQALEAFDYLNMMVRVVPSQLRFCSGVFKTTDQMNTSDGSSALKQAWFIKPVGSKHFCYESTHISIKFFGIILFVKNQLGSMEESVEKEETREALKRRKLRLRQWRHMACKYGIWDLSTRLTPLTS